MSNFRPTGPARNGRFEVTDALLDVTGTVPQPTVSGPYFDNDTSVETSEGTATKVGPRWELGQTVETETGSVSGTVSYSATELGLRRWAPRHDPAKPKKVQLGGGLEATYNEDGTVTREGTDGTFTCDSRTWRMQDIAGDRSAFVRAKADHDWTQRTPFPPQANHTPNPQYVGASNVLLNRDPVLEPYFGRPEARRLSNGDYEEKSSRFTWLTATWTAGDLALRDRDGAVTNEQTGSWGSAEIGWTDNVADRTGETTSASNSAVGAKQRLRIRIPDVATQMTLGEAYRNQDSQGFAYPGFGVETVGHVFIDAKGADSTITLQSKKDTIVQAEGAAAIGGKGGLAAASAGGVLMAGGGGVTIIGGQPNGWIANRSSDGTSPGSPPWMSNVAAASGTIAAVGAGVDAWIALSGATKAIHDAKQGNEPMPWRGTFLKVAGYFGGVFGGLVSTIGALGALDGSAQSLNLWSANGLSTFASQLGGTFIHGTGGMILTSSVTTGIYSLLGTTIGTPLALGMFGGSVDLQGKEDVGIQASKGKMSISAGTKMHLSASDEVTISSLTKSVDIAGATIVVGNRTGSGGQAGSDNVTIDAKQVHLASETISLLRSNTQVTVQAPSTRLEATKGITLVSTGSEGIGISAGSGAVAIDGSTKAGMRSGEFLAYVTPSMAVLGKAPGQPPAAPTPPTLEKHPARPKSKLALPAYWLQCKAIDMANADKQKAYANQMKDHQAKVANMKEAQVGVLVKSSAVELVVNGHKLTLDAGAVKHASLKIMK